jgi:hypothetical protein
MASPATTGNLQENRLHGEALPPPTTARPIENEIPRKRLMLGAVPPPTTATQTEKEIKTSWDELISPRLRQLAWAGQKATERVKQNIN